MTTVATWRSSWRRCVDSCTSASAERLPVPKRRNLVTESCGGDVSLSCGSVSKLVDEDSQLETVGLRHGLERETLEERMILVETSSVVETENTEGRRIRCVE